MRELDESRLYTLVICWLSQDMEFRNIKTHVDINRQTSVSSYFYTARGGMSPARSQGLVKTAVMRQSSRRNEVPNGTKASTVAPKRNRKIS